MRVTKNQLKRLIREEHGRLLQEQGGWGEQVDTGSPLIEFARAYAGLGGAVQEQVDSVLVAWVAGAHSPDWEDAIWAQNPNAIQMAVDRLGGPLRTLGQTNPDAEELFDALEEAQLVFSKGEG